MPWRDDGDLEGMRIKQEIRQVEPPRSLILSNNSTRDIDDIVIERTKNNNKVSPETLSHRLEKGWQSLQECPDPFLNNNNNEDDLPLDLNDNNNQKNNTLDDRDISSVAREVISPSFADGEYREMSSDDSASSSDDESSASFSDTSPLLDVSSLGEDDDSDMSEDTSSTSSSSSCLLDDDCNNSNLNNNLDEDEEEMSVAADSSWMSFSSSSSSAPHQQVVLPDVLPKMPDNNDAPCRNLEITFEKRRSNNQELCAPRVSSGGECCLVEITAQPDVQVDIRVNPVHRETRSMPIKHGNTYPREARSNKRYLKNRDINAWIVNDSFDEHNDDRSSKYCTTLGEGIRLNNFTIVNGHKTLSLTELVNPNETTFQKMDPDNRRGNKTYSRSAAKTAAGNTFTNSYQNFERNYSKLPANVHMCCKDNWRHQKDFAALKQKPSSAGAETAAIKKYAPSPIKKPEGGDSQKPKVPEEGSNASDKSTKQNISTTRIAATSDTNSNKLMQASKLPAKSRDVNRKGSSYYSKKKASDSKLSSPELFEVYTMETALPQINWAAISKGSRENDWIRKRRNDREEIRRKLAMDSDTEDYISEKLSQHREGGCFDRLKSTGNLQICFMNEAAKEQELSNPEEEISTEKNKVPPMQRAQKPTLHLPPTFQKCEKPPVPKLQNNNISPLSVTKRQRPKFFFNRPRSWHASKQDENPFPEEDLLTRHIRLQAEAREALAQAKDMARMQMEIERQKKKKSPIADIVGLPFPDGKNSLSHHVLVAMNVAQLQVIVNDLHSQIETLNEDLVKFLLERDDLHMEQDSKLVDIEDLTRYLGLKGSGPVSSSSSQVSVNSIPDSKKIPQVEPVRRSQSVHLKSKNLM